ncbi:MAG TPA: GMP synthase [Vulgatibacter sp.]|nr:GMP synthase [Vulgatibacter sp.]
MTLPKLLVIAAGSTHPEVVRSCGDYDAWFRRALPDGESRCETVSPFAGDDLPDPSRYGGAIITGSPASVRDEAPWMARVAAWALAAADAGVAVLGVCFGHQLLGEALGGRVEPSPKSRELGTIDVHLTEEGRADPLFAGLPATLRVQSTHGDELAQGPDPSRAVRLAGNDHSRWQAFAAGPRIRAVQFHPESTEAILRRVLEAHGQGAPIDETGHGLAILRNWDRHFVRVAGEA